MSFRGLFATALLGALTSTISTAAPITGTFNIAGTITVTPTTFTWTTASAPFTPNKANLAAGTGSFAGLGGTLVTIQSLNSAIEPVGVPFPAQNFITFDAAPAFPALNINFIFQGIYSNAQCATLPPAVGQQCTVNPPASPFNFVNNPPGPPTGPQATATFVFAGVTSDGLENWQGNFTSSFTVPYQTVLAQLASTGSVTQTFAATFTLTPAAVPETSSLSLLGLGLGLIGLSTKLRRRISSR